jgi:hypothetical protein
MIAYGFSDGGNLVFDTFQRGFGDGKELFADFDREWFFVASSLGTAIVIIFVCSPEG